MFRVGMRIDQWKVAKNESQLLTRRVLDRFDDWISLAACRAFVVAILDQRQRRVGQTLNMITLADRHGQAGVFRAAVWIESHTASFWLFGFFFAGSVSKAARIPAAPGFTPIGET